MARNGDERFTMTPVEGLTWTYDELWKPIEKHEVPLLRQRRHRSQ